MAKALIVVDMQNDFVKGHMSTQEAREILPAVADKLEQYRREGALIRFTLDSHMDGDYVQERPTAEAAGLPKHCIRGSEGWKIVDELCGYVQEGDNTVEKPTFLGLELTDHLPGIADSPEDTIELCGVCTDICVLSNALYLRAKYPRVKIVVDAACCAGLTPDTHRAALTAMRSCLITVQ